MKITKPLKESGNQKKMTESSIISDFCTCSFAFSVLRFHLSYLANIAVIHF